MYSFLLQDKIVYLDSVIFKTTTINHIHNHYHLRKAVNTNFLDHKGCITIVIRKVIVDINRMVEVIGIIIVVTIDIVISRDPDIIAGNHPIG